MEEKLSPDKIKDLKNSLPEPWVVDQNSRLVGEFEFSNFKNAMSFINGVADLAESVDHHPDISISYNKVRLQLSTHSARGLTEKDFELANKIVNPE